MYFKLEKIKLKITNKIKKKIKLKKKNGKKKKFIFNLFKNFFL